MNALLRSIVVFLAGFSVMSVGLATSSTTSLIWESAGSLSRSLRGSSNSSSDGPNVAAGDYKILGIAAVAQQPDLVALTLQAVGTKPISTEFELLVPRTVVDRAELSSGATITARDRPYGLEFSVAGQAQAFYLLLHDEWYRDLRTHAVTL
jgi:hypothetical protein